MIYVLCRSRCCGGSAVVLTACFSRGKPLVERSKDDWNKKQGRNGCTQQAAYHSAAKRRLLLRAFADTDRHRNHAGYHRQSRHQNRAPPRATRLKGGGERRKTGV